MLNDTRQAVRGTSRGLAGIGQMPAFDLPAAGGGHVHSWDYRSRRHLVLWLTGRQPDRDALAAAVGRTSALQAEGAVLLVVVLGPVEEADRLRSEARLSGPILADVDGTLHARLDADAPTMLVAGRNATVYWRATVRDAGATLDEALSWLEYLNILEPECGSCVPAWPTE
ncbi:MAG: hypothetical protein IT305_03135 [Chloroflexi bacterium]|nr:hypothetical protein [Chloroflexota bacterium]